MSRSLENSSYHKTQDVAAALSLACAITATGLFVVDKQIEDENKFQPGNILEVTDTAECSDRPDGWSWDMKDTRTGETVISVISGSKVEIVPNSANEFVSPRQVRVKAKKDDVRNNSTNYPLIKNKDVGNNLEFINGCWIYKSKTK